MSDETIGKTGKKKDAAGVNLQRLSFSLLVEREALSTKVPQSRWRRRQWLHQSTILKIPS